MYSQELIHQYKVDRPHAIRKNLTSYNISSCSSSVVCSEVISFYFTDNNKTK